ncbi:MAG: chorismate synthase [Chlamydiae bacterium]|nr:chorismate synthase [Chlamydiota bacterium]
MGSNAYGTIFKFTTWGESHGKAIGVVIDGCPAGLSISVEEINAALESRAPGRNSYTSPRKEPDIAEILSGVFEGKTTGAPISISIANKDADSSKYEEVKDLLKPGHANSSYLAKYGHFDYRGGGRASARETACRVAAGAIAKKLLLYYGIKVEASLTEIGGETDPACKARLLEKVMKEGDSIGGVVEFIASGISQGLGDPVYKKLEAELAYALLSIPACKGFEIGSGFASSSMKGSEHNDLFIDKVTTSTNNAGGVLGGISTGMPLVGRVVFKPSSSIKKPQRTVSLRGEPALFELPNGSRHDPCVAIRAVPVVEAMIALVLIDALLINRCSRL